MIFPANRCPLRGIMRGSAEDRRHPALRARQAFARDPVAALERRCALVALDSLLAVALLLESDPAPGPGVGVAVFGVDRRVQILDGLVVLPGRDEALAACRIGRGDEGVAVDGGVEIEKRGAVVALTLVHEAAGGEGFGR